MREVGRPPHPSATGDDDVSFCDIQSLTGLGNGFSHGHGHVSALIHRTDLRRTAFSGGIEGIGSQGDGTWRSYRRDLDRFTGVDAPSDGDAHF